MAEKTNEFEVWQNDCPVVVMATLFDFEIWQYDAAVEDIDESAEYIVTIRRRLQIF